MGMRIWIDHDECTGDGLCEETCSASFEVGVDGVAYVREDAAYFERTRIFRPGAEDATDYRARVPEAWADAAVEAAETCPGECIFIEVD